MHKRPTAPGTVALAASGEGPIRLPRLDAVGASIALHVLVGTLLIVVPWPEPAPRADWEFPRVVLDSQELVFRAPEKELPPISATSPDKQGGRGEVRADRRVTIRDPNPESAREKLLAPGPTLPLTVPSADVLSVAPKIPPVPRVRYEPREKREAAPAEPELADAPEIEAPAPAAPALAEQQFRLRYRSAEPQRDAPSEQALADAEAPDIATAPAPTAALATDTPRVRFWQRESHAGADPEQDALESEAPEIGTSSAPAPNPRLAVTATPRLRYVERGRGGSKAGPTERAVGGAPAPAIDAAAPAPAAVVASGGPAPVRFRAEYAGARANGSVAPSEQALPAGATPAPGVGAAPAPPPEPGAVGRMASLRINLRPPAVPASQASGKQSAAFSSAPDADGRPGRLFKTEGARSLPNVSVEGQPRSDPRTGDPGDQAGGLLTAERFRARDAEPRVLARASVTRPPPGSLGGPPPASKRPPPKTPEAYFIDRRSYEMSIQMPNLSSYSGSWQIRFAELGAEPTLENSEPIAADRLAAPRPRKKVDPKYVRAAEEEGVEGEIWLRGIIFEDGEIAQIRVVKPLDPRLDRTARQALAQWEFLPASRAGRPVAVEVLVTIPFRLTSLTRQPGQRR